MSTWPYLTLMVTLGVQGKGRIKLVQSYMSKACSLIYVQILRNKYTGFLIILSREGVQTSVLHGWMHLPMYVSIHVSCA